MPVTVRVMILTLALAGCSGGHAASAPPTAAASTSTTTPRVPETATTSDTSPADTTVRPKVTVTPDHNLFDGERVTVNVTGYGVGGKVFLSECASAADVSGLGCPRQLAEQPFTFTGNDRSWSGPFVIHAHASTKTPNLTAARCTSTCVLVATAGIFAGYPDNNYAYTPISFARA